MRTRAKISTEPAWERCVPDCPHCGSDMDGALVRLEDLLTALPIPGWIRTGPDGYAGARNASVIVRCPSCDKPSALAVTDAQVKLIACRTEKDERLLGGRS